MKRLTSPVGDSFITKMIKADYMRDGFLIVPDLFSKREVRAYKVGIAQVLDEVQREMFWQEVTRRWLNRKPLQRRFRRAERSFSMT